jgi:hypothetical protein
MGYWENKSMCSIKNKCQSNDIINNINPEYSYYDNINYYTNFKNNYILRHINNDNIEDLCIFIKNNYNFHYSIDVLKKLTLNPFTNEHFNLILYDKDLIIGIVICITKKIYIQETLKDVVSVLLLCVHKNYRNKKIGCYLLDTIIINIKNHNINIGIFSSNKYLNNNKYLKKSFLYKRSILKNKITIDFINLGISDFDIKKDNLYIYYDNYEIDYWFNNNIVKNFKYQNNVVSFIPIIYLDKIVYFLFYKNIKNINSYNKLLKNILPTYELYIYDDGILDRDKHFKIINAIYYYIYNYHVSDFTCTNLII